MLLFVSICYCQNSGIYGKVIAPSNPGMLQSEIFAAYERDRLSSVTIAPGTYRIPFTNNPNANLLFTNMRNFVINANDVILVMLDNRKRGLAFYNCYNVTVRGRLTIRNDIIPFSQGQIESISQNSFVINIDDGYPRTLDDSTFFPASTAYYVFDRNTRRLKDYSYDYYNSDVKRVDERRFRVIFDQTVGSEVAVGDLIAMRGKGDYGVISEICELMSFIDVTVEYAGLFAWFEIEGKGNNRYERITAQPGPKPSGATKEPLMSSNADGFHSSNVRRGPTILNSFFTRMADDGIAVHGEYQLIRQVQGNIIICMRKWSRVPYSIGDRITVVGSDGMPRGQTTVKRFRALPYDHLPSITTSWPHFNDNHYYFELELDNNLNGNIFVNDVISNLDQTGSGYILQGNTILDNRARGILVKAHDGYIESNRINGSSMAGIVMQPELWWGEGNYGERVTIRNNTLMRCGYATSGSWTEQAGVLTIYGTGTSSTAYGHHSLLIENNLFSNNDGVQMVLDSLKYVTVRNNIFLHGQQKPNNRGSQHGIDGGAIVHINRANSLKLENNRARCFGSANTRLIQTTSLTNYIEGSNDGIIMEKNC